MSAVVVIRTRRILFQEYQQLKDHEYSAKVFKNVFALGNFPLISRHSPKEKVTLIIKGEHYF